MGDRAVVSAVTSAAGADAAMATLPSVDELEKREEELFQTGPLAVLTSSVKANSQVRGGRV